MAPYHAIKDVTMKDTWTVDPLSKFTFEERSILKKALKTEFDRYMELAEQRHPKRTSIMMSEEEEQLRTDVMRRNVIQELKVKHMQEFRRKMVD